MDIGIVSMRYAKALMEYAKSTGTEDRLYTEMRTLSRSFEKHSACGIGEPCTAGTGEILAYLYRSSGGCSCRAGIVPFRYADIKKQA